MSRAQVVVFAKAPRAGLVKTRLSPPLSLDECAWLYERMLADVLDTTQRFALARGLDAILAFHPPEAVGELLVRAPRGYRLHAQRGSGLGERMANAFAEGAAAGAEWVLVRGSDSPGLGERHLEAAVDALEAGHEVVFTPDQGGGYAMIGLRAPCPALFEVAMSTDDMLAQTRRIADRLGLRSSVTEPTFDIDTEADLHWIDGLDDRESSDSCRRTVEAFSILRESGVL